MAIGNGPADELVLVSHAHEFDIPGTVDLNAREGEPTGYGQALYPVPSDDPNDPLQVSRIHAMLFLFMDDNANEI